MPMDELGKDISPQTAGVLAESQSVGGTAGGHCQNNHWNHYGPTISFTELHTFHTYQRALTPWKLSHL